MSTADEFEAVERCIRGSGEWQTALAALERIKAKHQLYVDAAGRVTDYANALRPAPYSTDKSINVRHAVGIRRALGDAYMGGPLT